MKSLVAGAAMIASISAAEAAQVNVSVSGLFFGKNPPTGAETAPVTAETAPGQSFGFSFSIVDPIVDNPVTSFIKKSYLLAASEIDPKITSITFKDQSQQGLFNVAFSDGNVLSLYGSNILLNGHLESNIWFAAVALDGGNPIGGATVSVSEISPVPLPASAPLFGMSLLAVAAIGSVAKRRRGSHPVA